MDLNPLDLGKKLEDGLNGLWTRMTGYVDSQLKALKKEILTEIYQEGAANALARLESLNPEDLKYKKSLDDLN